MVPKCGTVTSSRVPADSLTHSPSDKAEVAVAAATFKVAVLDADVVAVVTVAAIRVALVTKDVADADTTVGAKVCTTKETKAPTTKATRTLATKAVGAGPTTAGPIIYLTLHQYSLSLRMLRAFATYLYPAP